MERNRSGGVEKKINILRFFFRGDRVWGNVGASLIYGKYSPSDSTIGRWMMLIRIFCGAGMLVILLAAR
jgi:hypothetical protein